MLVTPLMIVALVRPLQSTNASAPMLVMLPGIVMLARLEQYWKAPSPMLETPLLIVTLVKLAQLENASAPRLVTPPGIVMLLKLVHS